MKKLVLVITLAAIALSGSAFAQDPAYFDNIGIYVDEAATSSCATLPVGPANAYLVITKMTAGEVLAWEAKIIPENVFITSFTPRGDAVDVANRAEEHIVGLATALPAVGGAVVIADINLYIPETSFGSGTAVEGAIYANEVYFSLLENGLPAYIDAFDNNKSLHPANTYGTEYLGSVNDPIFVVNGACTPVANEELSFGSVKSLFR